MERKSLWLPKECLSRPVEYLKGGKGYSALRAQGEITRLILNLANYALRPYHFDNIADFLDNQEELEHGIPLVFPDLEVKVAKRNKEIQRLELILGDNSGTLKAIYDWTPRIIHDPGAGDRDMAIDPMNNPLFGAEPEDTLKIYNAMYAAQSTISLDPFRVLNDKHYQ